MGQTAVLKNNLGLDSGPDASVVGFDWTEIGFWFLSALIVTIWSWYSGRSTTPVPKRFGESDTTTTGSRKIPPRSKWFLKFDEMCFLGISLLIVLILMHFYCCS